MEHRDLVTPSDYLKLREKLAAAVSAVWTWAVMPAEQLVALPAAVPAV